MEIGMQAVPCKCTTHCEKAVEPMNDCVCKLPGTTVTAFCDVCDPTHQKFTWHNNGSCISCVRRVREERKAQAAARHAKVLEAPANPNPIDDAEIVEAPKPRAVNKLPSPAYVTIHLPDRSIVIDDPVKVIQILAGLL